MEKEELTNLNEVVADLENNFFNNSLIQDNKIIIPVGNKLMRIRMPNQYEQSLAEEARNCKYIEMISSEKCATEKKIIRLLKEKEIADIDELRKEKDKVSKKLQDVWLNLAIKYTSEENTIEKLKSTAKELMDEIKVLSFTISEHLAPSIETQIEKAYMEKITSLCTDKCVGENAWEKQWSSFEDYQNDDKKMTDTAITYMSWLLLNSKG